MALVDVLQDIRGRAVEVLRPPEARVLHVAAPAIEKAPQALQTRLPGLSVAGPDIFGQTPKAGVGNQIGTYNDSPSVRGISDRVASTVSQVTWLLRRPKNKRRASVRHLQRVTKHADLTMMVKDMREELDLVTDHALLDLLHAGNPHHSASDVWKIVQIHLDLGGETFLLVGRNRLGVPNSLFPLSPAWIMETPSQARPAYRISWGTWQDWIPAQDVVWLKNADPVDPYARGSGFARALAHELETDEYQSRHVRAFFLNRARPDLIASPSKQGPQDGPLSQAEVDRFEESWLRGHQGFNRGFRAMFVPTPVDVQEISQNLEGLALEKLREQFDRKLIETWGMPPEILGRIQNSNRSTIDSADFLYQKNVITPRLEFLREHLQDLLCPLFPADDLVLDFVSVIPTDTQNRRELMKSSPAAFMLDEVREAAGLPPLPGKMGQAFLVPNSHNVVARPSDAGRSFQDV